MSTCLTPNVLVTESLRPFASPEELRELGEQAARVIRSVLSRSLLAYPENIADVLQESVLIVLSKCSAPDRESVRNIPAYLRKVARHAAIRFVKKEIAQQKLVCLAEAFHGGARLPEEPSPYDRLLVQDFLRKLSKRNRQLLLLTYVDDLSDREIQARLGYRKQGTVRVARFRALRALARIAQGTLIPHME